MKYLSSLLALSFVLSGAHALAADLSPFRYNPRQTQIEINLDALEPEAPAPQLKPVTLRPPVESSAVVDSGAPQLLKPAPVVSAEAIAPPAGYAALSPELDSLIRLHKDGSSVPRKAYAPPVLPMKPIPPRIVYTAPQPPKTFTAPTPAPLPAPITMTPPAQTEQYMQVPATASEIDQLIAAHRGTALPAPKPAPAALPPRLTQPAPVAVPKKLETPILPKPAPLGEPLAAPAPVPVQAAAPAPQPVTPQPVPEKSVSVVEAAPAQEPPALPAPVQAAQPAPKKEDAKPEIKPEEKAAAVKEEIVKVEMPAAPAVPAPPAPKIDKMSEAGSDAASSIMGAAPEKLAMADLKPVDAAPAEKPAVPSHGDMTIPFGADEAALTKEMETRLDAIAEDMKSMPALRIQIRAYADMAAGSESDARRLSLSRGLTVRSYLTEKGIAPARLDIRAMGPKTDTAPRDRVDIIFVR